MPRIKKIKVTIMQRELQPFKPEEKNGKQGEFFINMMLKTVGPLHTNT